MTPILTPTWATCGRLTQTLNSTEAAVFHDWRISADGDEQAEPNF
jgi:hypothetical protein